MSAPPISIAEQWRPEFPTLARTTYLNTCSLGCLSRASRQRVTGFLDTWEARGASAWYDTWMGALAELRARYAALLNARADEIALHPNISTALAALAEGIDYTRRPKVVTTALDFPTVNYQWMAKRSEGVEVVVLESPDGITVPLERFEEAIDDRTAIVTTSHVYFTSGAIQDVAAISAMARRHGALSVIDGYQAAGQLPVDVAAIGCDFYLGGGLKWLLGGPGIAFCFARRDVLPQITPRATGWFAHREQFRFDPRRFELHDDARRLEAGTPALAAVHAQLGGLDVIESLGVPMIREATMALTEDLIAGAEAAGLRLRVHPDPARRTAIVMLPSDDPHADVRRLAEAGCVTDARPGHVRVSPYFYNLPDEHRALLARFTRDD